MAYNVFGGTLSLTQSTNQSVVRFYSYCIIVFLSWKYVIFLFIRFEYDVKESCLCCCRWYRLRGQKLLGCHTIQRTIGKFPKLRCILSAKLVTASLVRFMKESGTTLRRSPSKLWSQVCWYTNMYSMSGRKVNPVNILRYNNCRLASN